MLVAFSIGFCPEIKHEKSFLIYEASINLSSQLETLKRREEQERF